MDKRKKLTSEMKREIEQMKREYTDEQMKKIDSTIEKSKGKRAVSEVYTIFDETAKKANEKMPFDISVSNSIEENRNLELITRPDEYSIIEQSSLTIGDSIRRKHNNRTNQKMDKYVNFFKNTFSAATDLAFSIPKLGISKEPNPESQNSVVGGCFTCLGAADMAMCFKSGTNSLYFKRKLDRIKQSLKDCGITNSEIPISDDNLLVSEIEKLESIKRRTTRQEMRLDLMKYICFLKAGKSDNLNKSVRSGILGTFELTSGASWIAGAALGTTFGGPGVGITAYLLGSLVAKNCFEATDLFASKLKGTILKSYEGTLNELNREAKFIKPLLQEWFNNPNNQLQVSHNMEMVLQLTKEEFTKDTTKDIKEIFQNKLNAVALNVNISDKQRDALNGDKISSIALQYLFTKLDTYMLTMNENFKNDVEYKVMKALFTSFNIKEEKLKETLRKFLVIRNNLEIGNAIGNTQEKAREIAQDNLKKLNIE
jgi:hypothetical protein